MGVGSSGVIDFPGVVDFLSVSAIPAGFVGTARVGTDLYMGDGTFLKPYSVPNISRKKLKVICVGNSIAVQAQSSGNGAYTTGSVLSLSNMLSNNVFNIIETPATTRSDGYGVYGYSGATLASINTDWIANFIPSLDNINYVPDIVWAIDLFTNDIGQDVPLATSLQQFQIFLSTIQAKWPGVILMIRTCMPNLSYTTQLKINTYNGLNNYVKSLDNSKNIFVYNNDFMSDSSAPSTVKKTIINGTCIGTTLTVNNIVSGEGGIENGWYVMGPSSTNYPITLVNQIGDTGTYSIQTAFSSDITPAQNITLLRDTYDGTHPTAWANYLSSKEVVKCLNRFVSEPKETLVVASANPYLTGSVSLSGTGYSGTYPVGVSVASLPGNCLMVGTALNPGLQITITSNVSPQTTANIGSGQILLTTLIPALGVDVYRIFTKVKIISGASYLRSLNFEKRNIDNGVNSSIILINTLASNTIRNPFSDGDIIDFCSPNIRSGGVGTLFTQIQSYFYFSFKEQVPNNAQIVVEIQKAGVYLPEDTSGYVTLVGGTATVTAGSKIFAKSKINLSLKTIGGTPGALFVSTKTVGTSFVITSTSATDTSVIYWSIDNS